MTTCHGTDSPCENHTGFSSIVIYLLFNIVDPERGPNHLIELSSLGAKFIVLEIYSQHSYFRIIFFAGVGGA